MATTDRGILTPRQQEVFDFIKSGYERGRAPTVREIMQHIGVCGPNGAMCHLQALVKKGWLVIDHGKSRGYLPTDDKRSLLLRRFAALPLDRLESIARKHGIVEVSSSGEEKGESKEETGDRGTPAGRTAGSQATGVGTNGRSAASARRR